jgi:hypothetical protein
VADRLVVWTLQDRLDWLDRAQITQSQQPHVIKGHNVEGAARGDRAAHGGYGLGLPADPVSPAEEPSLGRFTSTALNASDGAHLLLLTDVGRACMGSAVRFSPMLPRNGLALPRPKCHGGSLLARLNASFASGNVSASTPSSTRAVIASRSILFDSVNVRE